MSNSLSIQYHSLSDYIASCSYEHTSTPLIILNGERLLDCNQAALEYLGFGDKSEYIKYHFGQLSPEYQPDGHCSMTRINQYLKQCYQVGDVEFFWTHFSRKMGKLIESYIKLLDISYDGKKIVLGTIIDFNTIGKRYKREVGDDIQLQSTYYNLLNEHKKVIDFKSIVSKTNAEGKIIYVNKNFCDITGYHHEELIGNDHSIINHPNAPKSLFYSGQAQPDTSFCNFS